MTVAPTLTGVRLKLERAKKHLHELELAIVGFNETNPYEIVVHDNLDTGQTEWLVQRVDPLPPSLPLILGDAIHNGRSALDHLIRQLLVANGKDPEDCTYLRAGFTIWKSEAAFMSGRPGKAKGIGKDALDIFYALKPYAGGDDALSRLSRLDNMDKHRLVLAVAAAQQNIIIDLGGLMRSLSAANPHPEFPWLGQNVPRVPIALNTAYSIIMHPGAMIYCAAIGAETTEHVKLPIDITLDEPTIVDREPVVPFVDGLLSRVDQVIDLFAPLIESHI